MTKPPSPYLYSLVVYILDGGKELETQYNLVTPLILLLGTPESGRL